MIKAYTSLTTNKDNLKILARYPWRTLMSTSMPYSGQSLRKRAWVFDNGYAIDNGAYSDFVHDRPFQTDKFMDLLETWGEGADWVVIPDSIGNKDETIDLAYQWMPKLNYPLMFCVQDGMDPTDLIQFSPKICGVFVGGSTEWKLKSLPVWSRWARRHNKLCHVGRVNTVKRLKYCITLKATSFDGSGMSRFIETARCMTNTLNTHRKQVKLFDI